MKKSLLALAVLGAFAAGTAQAQTNVSIGGVIRANVKSYKVSSTTRQASNELRVDDDWTSRFWLTGTENLGGGLSALFYVENRFNTDVGSAAGVANGLGNGDTFVGLKGTWGQVTLGKHTWMATQGVGAELVAGGNTVAAIPTSALYTFSVFDQNGRLASGIYLDGGTRRPNSITYRTPSFSGFSGSVGIASGGGGTEGVITAGNPNYNDGKEYFLQGAYANGPLYLNLAYWNVDAEGRTAAGTDIQQYRFTGTYKIGGFKVGLAADRARVEAANGVGGKVSRTAWAIPVSYGFGNSTVMASVAKAGDLSGTNDTGAKFYTVGYDYALSKRTSVGAFYSRMDNDRLGQYQPFLAGTSGTGSFLNAGETASTIGLTVHHSF